MASKKLTPPLKWAGGKRQLLPEILKLVPQTFKTYIEPFLGGGAVLFCLEPTNAIVNDFNSELINFYKVVADEPRALITILKTFKNEPDFFYNIRSLDKRQESYQRMPNVEKAARLFYLNKTCYNGLYRVNSKGEFNTPYGRYKNPNLSSEDVLLAASKFFNEHNIEFYSGDFEAIAKLARKDDFIYLDPPYDDLGNDTSFASYTKIGFGREEQIRLKSVCDQLNKRGVKFLLSNSATNFILDLYQDYKVVIIKARRNINSNGSGRGVIDEVLIRNYE